MKTRFVLVVALLATILLTAETHAAKFSDTQYEEHIAELRGKLPDKGFTILIEKPFVVIGHHSLVEQRQLAQIVRLLDISRA